MSGPLPHPDHGPGTARLGVIVPVAILSFFYMNVLEYALPLYFEARTSSDVQSGGSFPLDVWAEVIKYKFTAWLVGPVVAGLLCRRYGERLVWGASLAAKMPVPLILAMHPHPNLIAVLAIWQGFTGALLWIAGASMFQMVAPNRKGFSNACMMTSIGVGSLLAPFAGRGFIYRSELSSLISEGNWSEFGARLLNLSSMTSTPQLKDFEILFLCLTGTTLICGLAIGLWAQRPGRFDRDNPPGWGRTLLDLKTLSRMPSFWALVVTLCVIGGPVFQSSNQFLPYRAKSLGLIEAGGEDHGWVWLHLLKVIVWIPGGAAVSLVAGRRAPGIAGAAMLGAFSLAALSIGASQTVWQLFCCVAAYEFTRQFMRWSHAGYISEHMPRDLRPSAIGFSISFAGVGSTIYLWVAPWIWDPKATDFNSAGPFWAAGTVGLVGALGLWLYDRFRPIREEHVQNAAD